MGPHLAHLDINLSLWQDLNAHFDALRSWGCQQLFLSLANLSSANTSTFFSPLQHAQAPQKGLVAGCSDLMYFWSSAFHEGGAWGADRWALPTSPLDAWGISQVFPHSVILNRVSFICLFSLITCCSPWGSSGLSCYEFDLEVEIGNRNQWLCDYNEEGMCPKG